MKHTELGLPMYYAIATMQGKAPMWKEAMENFNRIHGCNWTFQCYEFVGHDGNAEFLGGTRAVDNLAHFDTTVTVLTPEEFLNIVNKKQPTTMQKLTITVEQLLTIHEIACSTWKTKIASYMARMDASKNVTFTQQEVDEMFAAATAEQKPVLKDIFGEKKAVIDWDRIKTGSKVMIRLNGCQITHGGFFIHLSRPVDIVFFKAPHHINVDGVFEKKGHYELYCTFCQDGKFIPFSADENTDYITEVIEY